MSVKYVNVVVFSQHTSHFDEISFYKNLSLVSKLNRSFVWRMWRVLSSKMQLKNILVKICTVILLISTILTSLSCFADVFFNSRVWPYISASLSVSVSLPLPSLSPNAPKGLRSTDAHQHRVEEEEVPSVNTKCFELVQIDYTKWLNNVPRNAPQLLVQ